MSKTARGTSPDLGSIPSAPTKTCARCNLRYPRTSEHWRNDKRRKDGLHPYCKDCHREIALNRQYTDEEREAIRSRRCPVCGTGIGDTHPNRVYCSNQCRDLVKRAADYGLSLEDWQALTATGRCPICGNRVTKWQIDHNHDTGETYGPVCTACNQLLLAGSKHDVEIASKLVAFLGNPPARMLDGEPRVATRAMKRSGGRRKSRAVYR